MEIAIGVDIAESGTNRLVNEEQICKLIPAARVILERLVILESVRPNLHQRAIHRAASGSSIQPNNGPLAVRDVAVLEVPEEQVTVGLRVDFNVAG